MIEALRSNERLWELFTKKEEYQPCLLDQYQRFPHYLSKHGNVLEPEVSVFLIRNGLKAEYPEGKAFAVCLTHDIDVVYPYRLTIACEAAMAIRKRQIVRSFKILLSRVSKQLNPIWNFKQIMDLEEKYSARSSFYFLALEKGEPGFNFRIKDLKKELLNIIDRGWEVGLHGGHQAYNSLTVIKKEKSRLENVIGKKVIGYRNHFLRFKVPTTWELLEKAGFKYDTTFGYADRAGFRNGMCHPFKPFNLNTNRYMNILEVPLIVMDWTLENYMSLDFNGAWEMTKGLIDTVEKCKGVITILWHNTHMTGKKLEFYEKMLRYCYDRDAWMTGGENIWEWWMKTRG